jgi:hypothetical protein
MDLSIRITEQSVMVSRAQAGGCPVRQPSEEGPVQNADGFLPPSTQRWFYFLSVDKKHRMNRLNKDRLFFGSYDFPTAVEGRKERLGVELLSFWPPPGTH